MSSIQATLQQLADWFAAKNPRERLLLGVASLAVLVTVSDMLVLRPASDRRAAVEGEVISLREQLERDGELKLLRLESLPAEPLSESEEAWLGV